MTLKLYYLNASPPVRSVLLLIKALDVHVELIPLNLLEQEHLKDEFLSLNPQHTIPTLITEDGRSVWDSHAINLYLVEKYAKDDSLYPKDAYQRSVINQKLFFDSELVFNLVKSISFPVLKSEPVVIKQENVDKANEIFEYLEKYLEGNDWVCGNQLTIADFSLISSITTLDFLVSIDNKFKNIHAWLSRAKSLPYYKINEEGMETYRSLIGPLVVRKY